MIPALLHTKHTLRELKREAEACIHYDCTTLDPSYYQSRGECKYAHILSTSLCGTEALSLALGVSFPRGMECRALLAMLADRVLGLITLRRVGLPFNRLPPRPRSGRLFDFLALDLCGIGCECGG